MAIISATDHACSVSTAVPVSMSSHSIPHLCLYQGTTDIMSLMGKVPVVVGVFLLLTLSISLPLLSPSLPLPVSIMSLQALDEYAVSDEEIIENMSIQGKFQTFSPHLKLQLYTPISEVCM